MDPFPLLVAPPLAVAVTLLIRLHPGLRRYALLRYARRVDLPISTDLQARIERLFARRSLWMDLGALCGTAAVAAWAAITRPAPMEWSLWMLVVFGALFAGGAVGAGLSAVQQATRRADPHEPRVARPTAVALADYLIPLELHGGRVLSFLPALTLAAAWGVAPSLDLAPAGSILTTGTVLIALLPLLVGAGSEAAARRLLATPQAAGSDLELAWNDALRARVLRDLYTAPITVGVYATLGILIGLGGGLVDALVMAVLVLAVISATQRPHRHFRRQLWPSLHVEVAEGEAR